jgi:hypothetical protein
MGGPAAGVLLHQVPEDHEILALRTWLGGAARSHDASSNADLREGWEFFLNWPATLGDEPAEGSCLGDSSCVSLILKRNTAVTRAHLLPIGRGLAKL